MNHLSDAQLNEYLDKALSPAARLRADEHLQSCHACRDRLEQVEFVFDALAGLVDARLSRDLAPAVMAKLAVRQPNAWRPDFAAQLGVVIGAMLYFGLKAVEMVRLPAISIPSLPQPILAQLRIALPDPRFFTLLVQLPAIQSPDLDAILSLPVGGMRSLVVEPLASIAALTGTVHPNIATSTIMAAALAATLAGSALLLRDHEGPRMKRPLLGIILVILMALACGEQAPATPFPTPQASVFDETSTAYGFFPSPPEVSLDSVLALYKDLGQHADFVLIQQNTPWEDFEGGVDGKSQSRTDLMNQVTLARQNQLEYVFVVDALNGLNRREFSGLPGGWAASFANPRVRAATLNFALWIVRQFHPRYLGLASEINTYMDAHPEDADNFVSMYRDIYAAVKAQAPETKIFVTFQWEDLNNLIPAASEGRQPFETNWSQVEMFEPKLDLWVISSYPFVAFASGADIPTDYYTPLLSRTSKPLAVAEGGYTSAAIGPISGTPEDQVAYLNAMHDQIGRRLAFWVYLLLNDFNVESYSKFMKASGQGTNDISTLGLFASVGLRKFDGSPKPAMETWDLFRQRK